MQTTFFKRMPTLGLLPLITASLAACDAPSDPAPDKSAASEATIDTPAATTTATPAAVANSAVSDDPVPTSTAAPSPSPKPAVAPVKPTTGATTPTSARPVPAPSPSATNDPHAGHDMTGMSDEDMKAMGHE